MYHILTDIDSTSLQFLFVSDSSSDKIQSKYREIISEVICASKIAIDLIHPMIFGQNLAFKNHLCTIVWVILA